MSSTLGLAGLGSATVDILTGLADPFALLPSPRFALRMERHCGNAMTLPRF
jgi:hypothetical protein